MVGNVCVAALVRGWDWDSERKSGEQQKSWELRSES